MTTEMKWIKLSEKKSPAGKESFFVYGNLEDMVSRVDKKKDVYLIPAHYITQSNPFFAEGTDYIINVEYWMPWPKPTREMIKKK